VNLGRALTNLARLDVALGDPIAAIANLEAARRLSHATLDSTGELNAIGQLATALSALGDPQAAFAALDTAQRMANRLGFRREEAEDLTLIGDLFSEAGDHRHALDYYGRALAATDSLGLPEEHGNILRSVARAQALLGNGRLAVQRGLEALRVHRDSGFRAAELEDRILLAELSTGAEADAHLRDAKRLARLLDAAVAEARVARAEAQVALNGGDAKRALRVLDNARESLGLLDAGATADVMMIRARAHASLGQLEAAAAAGAQAIAAVERIRGSYRSDELRTSYAAGKSALYADQALLLLRLGRAQEAFRVADAARGRALLEHLAAARADVRADARAQAALEREDLLRRIDALVARLDERESRPPRERTPEMLAANRGLSDSLVAARKEYEALLARSADGLRSPATSLLGASVSLAEVQASLATDEALLEYLVTPSKLLVFVVTRSALSTFDAPEPASALASRVRLARELIQQSPGDSAVRGVLRALHGALIRPAETSGVLAGVRRLVVVPHGVLAYLPFAALIDSTTGRYVVERYALLHESTASAFVAMRSGTAKNSHRSEIGGGVAFAPFPVDLPATRDEARSFVRAVRSSTAAVGPTATEARLRAAIQSGALIHVATHAVMNPRNPLFSRIEMSGTRAGASDDDGRLEVHELLGLSSSSPLVFLSGCETALGAGAFTPFEPGEDFTTIGQALLYTGARNVVATLWRIDDAAAAQFADRFYTALQGQSAADALAEAQRGMIAGPQLRSPYLWAAYQISGSGTVFDRPEKPRVASDKR
jgi:CHAT domain-containing protein